MEATGRYRRRQVAGWFRRGDRTPWGDRRFMGRDGSEWVPPAHSEEESARLYGYNPHSQVKMVMTPAEYRRLAEQIWVRQGASPTHAWKRKQEELDEARERGLAARFAAGEVVDAAFLDIDPETMEPLAQEGAHRTVLAGAMGMHKIPVIVYARHRGRHEWADADFRARLARYGEVVG